MQHFFLEPRCFKEDKVKVTDADVLHQLRRVLRMRTGDLFMALDNEGFEYECEVSSIDDRHADAWITDKRPCSREPTKFITLYQALPKKNEIFEMILQKGTELGVSRFVPILTEFTQNEGFIKRERLERIIKEAAEQSERGRLPILVEPTPLHLALKNMEGQDAFLFHSRGELPFFSDELKKTTRPLSLFIGPEGGFSDKEVEMSREKTTTVSLGSRILRMETAAIVATAFAIDQ